MRARSGRASDGLPVHHHRQPRTERRVPDRAELPNATALPVVHAATDQHLLTAPTPTPTAAPPAAEALPPQNGYVFIETKSAKTRCQISAEEVGCESAFTNPPEVDGLPASGVRLTAAGQVQWTDGNLGDIPVETIDYRTYSAEGWTIVATEDGTRFTNDGTRHGMFISVSGVEVF